MRLATPPLVLLGFLLLCGSAGAQERPILGVVDDVGPSLGALVSINRDNGAAFVIGTPLPGVGLTGVATLTNGQLVASTLELGGSRLLGVDAESGSAVVIGPLLDGAQPIFVVDLAVNPVDGLLYGIAFNSNAPVNNNNSLYLINPVSGASTLIGVTTTVAGGQMAISFTSDGVLHGSVANAPQLYTINTTNGATATAVSLDSAVGSSGLGTLEDDSLILAECCGVSVGENIFVASAATGADTLLGDSQQRVMDITLGPLPVPVTEVPTLGDLGTVVLALLLLSAGLFALRK